MVCESDGTVRSHTALQRLDEQQTALLQLVAYILQLAVAPA